MQASLPSAPTSELHAAFLQALITAGLAVLCWFMHRRHHKPYFAWWAGAWGLYTVRVAAIVSFLLTGDWIWLFWHQVVTGWTALALLYAALVFSRGLRWRRQYLAVALFPPVWAYIAIYRLDHFLWAAGPAVLFLSLATLWTGWAFVRYRRRVASPGATLLAASFVLWGLHHLDYPFLRARGAWNPWGYYINILLTLAVGAGILLLVLDDLRRGLGALSDISGDLQHAGREENVLDALLARPLTLPAVRGSALFLVEDGKPRFVRGAGVCRELPDDTGARLAGALLGPAIASGLPQVRGEWDDRGHGVAYPYTAALPLLRNEAVIGALLLVGDARDPFTALDDRFLVALGHQVGAALENADLYRRLETRTVDLARLSARMIEQHEEERRRLSRELHDETAQVFSAVRIELGVLRDSAPPGQTGRLDQVLELIDAGIRSIRNVTNDLRPSLLDDLGLLPALRSLVAEFSERSGIRAGMTAPALLPPLSDQAELALFRALQEALSNVLRHAGARSVDIGISVSRRGVLLEVRDDGRGLAADATVQSLQRGGHMGLAGMRERIGALGGTVRFRSEPGAGTLLEVLVPGEDGTS
ncbi:MAG TPA: GAF domain-containing sensor histidine kinase [Gemmatimonadales bacterium]|nr:GAF domain-containing sensor histidine kinase [Gemmatimonadales bacterium]